MLPVGAECLEIALPYTKMYGVRRHGNLSGWNASIQL